MVYVFLLNWCFHSTKLPLLRGSNRCVVREGACERMGENVHLCVRTQTAECEFCVCRCPCSLRHEDPVCSGNSSGEYSHIIFKSSWLRNLCTICEHIPSREMLQNHLWFLRQTKQMHFSKRALMKLAQQYSLVLLFSLNSVLDKAWASGQTDWTCISARYSSVWGCWVIY